jgi:hypothetical protein
MSMYLQKAIYVDYACVINVYNFAAFFVVVIVGSRSFFL